MTDITLALVWIAGGLYELWWFRVRRPKIRARAEQEHAANQVIAYAEGLTKGSAEAQEAVRRWQIRFTDEHDPLHPDAKYCHVTCGCGQRSGRLLEGDAARWTAEHLKQHPEEA